MTEAPIDECPPHEFITVKFLEKREPYKFCKKCGITAVKIPENTKFSIFQNGEWVEIQRTKDAE